MTPMQQIAHLVALPYQTKKQHSHHQPNNQQHAIPPRKKIAREHRGGPTFLEGEEKIEKRELRI